MLAQAYPVGQFAEHVRRRIAVQSERFVSANAPAVFDLSNNLANVHRHNIDSQDSPEGPTPVAQGFSPCHR
jgi:hypothetical protein